MEALPIDLIASSSWYLLSQTPFCSGVIAAKKEYQGFFAFMYYQSFIAQYKATVGGVVEQAISGLTPEEQVEVVKSLSKHLVNQGVMTSEVSSISNMLVAYNIH